MISKEEVEHIAKLARLELTKDEVEKMQKDLSAILDYFNLLEKARPVGARLARPKGEAAPKLNSLRKDESVPRDASLVERLVAAAPDKKEDYIKVKAIF
jgi:aspartyl-tRNA(Asn)/glutamyl-tRNA(Gln) amidotransferase subunit C